MSDNPNFGGSEKRSPAAMMAIATRRQQVVDILTDNYSKDILTVEEYEERVSRAQKAATLTELGAIISDLPRSAAESAAPPARPNPDNVQSIVTFLGEKRMRGNWLSKRDAFSLVALGSQVIDFSEVRLAPGKTTLEIVCFMGSIVVIVPPDLPVRVEAIPIMGDASVRPEVRTRENPDEAYLVVTGPVIMGSLTVKTR
jgi:hypothetical protein